MEKIILTGDRPTGVYTLINLLNIGVCCMAAYLLASKSRPIQEN